MNIGTSNNYYSVYIFTSTRKRSQLFFVRLSSFTFPPFPLLPSQSLPSPRLPSPTLSAFVSTPQTNLQGPSKCQEWCTINAGAGKAGEILNFGIQAEIYAENRRFHLDCVIANWTLVWIMPLYQNFNPLTLPPVLFFFHQRQWGGVRWAQGLVYGSCNSFIFEKFTLAY